MLRTQCEYRREGMRSSSVARLLVEVGLVWAGSLDQPSTSPSPGSPALGLGAWGIVDLQAAMLLASRQGCEMSCSGLWLRSPLPCRAFQDAIRGFDVTRRRAAPCGLRLVGGESTGLKPRRWWIAQWSDGARVLGSKLCSNKDQWNGDSHDP